MPFDFIPESRSISLGIPIVSLPIKGSATVQWVKSPECLDLAAHHRGDFHDPSWIGAGRTQIAEVLGSISKLPDSDHIHEIKSRTVLVQWGLSSVVGLLSWSDSLCK